MSREGLTLASALAALLVPYLTYDQLAKKVEEFITTIHGHKKAKDISAAQLSTMQPKPI